MKVLLIGGSSAGQVVDVPEDSYFINTSIQPGGLRGGAYAPDFKVVHSIQQERYYIFRIGHMAIGYLETESIEEALQTLANTYIEATTANAPTMRY